MSDNVFDGFEAEVKPVDQLPYCQVQNPPNLPLSTIKQGDFPWGVFIEAKQAEIAGFNYTDDWSAVSLFFDKDTENEREVFGGITQHIRCCILHQSNIEVQEKGKRGWYYAGLAYERGKLTELGEFARKQDSGYRINTRRMIVFLGDDYTPLHQTPFQIRMSAGTGGAFGEEVKSLRSEIETIFFASKGLPKEQLSDRVHSLVVLDTQLGLHKNGVNSPFLVPISRLSPTMGDKPNETTVVERRNRRKVTLQYVPFDKLIIPKGETRDFLLNLYDQHINFPTMYSNNTKEVEHYD